MEAACFTNLPSKAKKDHDTIGMVNCMALSSVSGELSICSWIVGAYLPFSVAYMPWSVLGAGHCCVFCCDHGWWYQHGRGTYIRVWDIPQHHHFEKATNVIIKHQKLENKGAPTSSSPVAYHELVPLVKKPFFEVQETVQLDVHRQRQLGSRELAATHFQEVVVLLRPGHKMMKQTMQKRNRRNQTQLTQNKTNNINKQEQDRARANIRFDQRWKSVHGVAMIRSALHKGCPL